MAREAGRQLQVLIPPGLALATKMGRHRAVPPLFLCVVCGTWPEDLRSPEPHRLRRRVRCTMPHGSGFSLRMSSNGLGYADPAAKPAIELGALRVGSNSTTKPSLAIERSVGRIWSVRLAILCSRRSDGDGITWLKMTYDGGGGGVGGSLVCPQAQSSNKHAAGHAPPRKQCAGLGLALRTLPNGPLFYAAWPLRSWRPTFFCRAATSWLELAE